ncbi:MAG: hypothetical protein ACI9MR_001927 [Myxococcota bacterium]|jgi:hypothetical protein
MKHVRLTIISLAILMPAAACEQGGKTLTDAERRQVVAECKSEVLAHLAEAGSNNSRPQPVAAPDRPTLSESERAAIAAARTRRLQPADGLVDPTTPPVVADSVVAEPATNPLTGEDLAAAADDPAARDAAGQAIGAGTDGGNTGIPSGEEIRPGTRLFNAGGGVTLVDLAVATEIKDRLPQNVTAVYTTMPETLFCYSVFNNPLPSATVTHVWRRGQRLVSRVELEVGKSTKWRTWSRQRTRPKWTGPWSCEVLDPEGRRIGLVTFAIDV